MPSSSLVEVEVAVGVEVRVEVGVGVRGLNFVYILGQVASFSN